MRKPRDCKLEYERRLLPEKQNRKCGITARREPLRKGLLRAALDLWEIRNGFSSALSGSGVWPKQRAI